ncbi:hypothetical protein BJ138DRAFT_1078570 [Hygrophoropsis aurantiaca]|uniref:Uncharacterized protein n=1 Tax=Hygrophoropsis aurantiaca TaxID=72124 RepID=A0ACB8ANX8_9AGAM|nr:hypothetical protein BJ138DRAFT_1078570 [Hygrophoropsis aurantiaca]
MTILTTTARQQQNFKHVLRHLNANAHLAQQKYSQDLKTDAIVRSFSSSRRRLNLSTPNANANAKASAIQTQTKTPRTNQLSQSWLTKKVRSSPALLALFLGAARALGYGSPQQLANRRALALYNEFCAQRADEEAVFWRDECALPPTFQSWFTITNLHVWLLTVRLRALPAPLGTQHVQGLIDHFFQDVEERVRGVLQPGVLPPRVPPSASQTAAETLTKATVDPRSASYISPYPSSAFYHTPAPALPASLSSSPSSSNPPSLSRADRRALIRARAPERIVTRQMKIFREQWAGLGMSFDLGLVKGDAEMAGAVWRNLLGARGARGISGDGISGAEVEQGNQGFRRSVNLVGGLVESVEKVDKRGGVEAEEARDDGSGVCDFVGGDVDRYLKYPELMATIATYLRRESVRLEGLTDAEVMGPRKLGREGEGLAVVVGARGDLSMAEKYA